MQIYSLPPVTLEQSRLSLVSWHCATIEQNNKHAKKTGLEGEKKILILQFKKSVPKGENGQAL